MQQAFVLAHVAHHQREIDVELLPLFVQIAVHAPVQAHQQQQQHGQESEKGEPQPSGGAGDATERGVFHPG